ncbi:hypothetical protein PAXRUDRAFT_199414 [Paxillus rubicundulus Ve08.2h10]|uniref:Uncharacterized protein n=1 Tax=Paxillus rubicundulus Ve08.2h10 TaxID=930991 RepID=A0A0D0CZR8_9AGAM|nr:hypothetical protein PAXRUDRAFT_199414 [Paxillus rubicundulus Ve08.2h10]
MDHCKSVSGQTVLQESGFIPCHWHTSPCRTSEGRSQASDGSADTISAFLGTGHPHLKIKHSAHLLLRL